MKNDIIFQDDNNKTEFMNYLNLFSSSIIYDLKLQKKNNNRHHNNLGFSHLKAQARVETYCRQCERSGDLLMCDHCEDTFHLHCLALTSVPVGQWMCPKCVSTTKTTPSEDWPNNLALLHSYVMLKTAKEEEKKRLRRHLEEGGDERVVLQGRATALKEALVLKLHEKCELLETCNSAKKILGVMRAFVQLVQSSGTF